MNEDALTSFMAITGADAGTAQQYLEITAWNMEEALNLFMESGGSGGASSQTGGATTTSGYADQEVRAPDPSKRQRLVGGDGFDSPRVFPAPQFFNRPVNISHYNDFTSSALNPNGLLQQDFVQDSIALLNQQMNSSRQSDDGGSLKMNRGGLTTYLDRSSRRDPQNLSQLFQPPTTLMFHGTFADARRAAKEQKKWLLVNIQDETIFASLMLNRDTWSDDLVQNLVESSFIFWQSPINNEHGKKFCSLYQIEADLLPIVCIVDPRTGQKLVEWYNFMEPSQMTEKLSDFCCLNSMDGAPIMPPRAVPPPPQKSIVDASEEEQLAAAIAASLQQDEDSDMEDCVEIEEKPAAAPPSPAPVILEPMPQEPSDGPMVTRIQIRTTVGTRLMRRFLKADPVSLLFRFVQHEIPESQSREFELRTSYPPKAIDSQAPLSISDAKLENASLMMQWK